MYTFDWRRFSVFYARERHILEMASRLDLEFMNRGSMPTYWPPSFGGSIPDITLVSADLFPLVAKWEVMNVYTASDNKFISFELKRKVLSQSLITRNTVRWNPSKLDSGKFFEQINSSPKTGLTMQIQSTDRTVVESLVSSTMQLIKHACDSLMPHKNLTKAAVMLTGGWKKLWTFKELHWYSKEGHSNPGTGWKLWLGS